MWFVISENMEVSGNYEECIMLKLPANYILLGCLLLGLVPVAVHSQTPVTKHSSPLVHVNAPLAQALVDKTMAGHNEISKLGIHAVPLGAMDNVIIACNIRSKNGKKSSPADLEKLAAAKPIAARIDKEQIFDLLIPMTDAHGGDLNGGFVVMEVPFSKAENEAEALKIGVAIRNEIQSQIPSRDAMYR